MQFMFAIIYWFVTQFLICSSLLINNNMNNFILFKKPILNFYSFFKPLIKKES